MKEHRKGHVGLKGVRIAAMTIGGIILAVCFAFLFGYVVMRLWNWLMPHVFGLPVLTYWQSVGIIVLAKLIFGSFGAHHHACHDDTKKHDTKHRTPWDEIGAEIKKEISGEMKNHFKDYGAYWEEEGKAAFEAYQRRKREEQAEE